MSVGEKSDQFHPDYIPTIFGFIKSPEKNRAKRQRQLEKYQVVQNMKIKRLRAALSESDKGNVRESESQNETVQITKDRQSMSVTNEEVSEYLTENVQVMNDNDEHQVENDENMNGEAQIVSEHENNNNDQVANEIPKQYTQTECQTEMLDVAAAELQSDSGRAKNKEC